MKKIIQKWLGIKDLQQETLDLRLRCQILDVKITQCEDGGSIFAGESAKVDSLKEFVCGMAKYLKLRPHRSYREVPVEPITTKQERVYEVIKVK